jgi:hypothetical protein
LEFIADSFRSLSLSLEWSDSGVIIVRMVHSGSPSLLTIVEESANEDDMASSIGGSSGIPISRVCNVVTLIVPITTTPPSEGTPAPLTIPTVSLRTTVSQPNTGLLPEQQQAYEEEQQARACARQADAERRAKQRQGELTDERTAIEAQLAELHHRKSTLEIEQTITVDLTNA